MNLNSRRNPVVFFTQRAKRERNNLAILRQRVAEFAPGAIMVWGMWNLSRSLVALAEDLCPQRTVYYFGDYWPTLPDPWWDYWQAPAQTRLSALPKRLLKPYAESLLEKETRCKLTFPHALFPSEFLCRAYQQVNVEIGQAQVIHGGVETELFRRVALNRLPSRSNHPIRLLIASRLLADKGIHTAIEALGILARQSKYEFHLSIVGTGDEPYVSRLHSLAKTLAVNNRVDFRGAVRSHEMPHLYGAHDVLIFPSIWQEPFGRVLVEAMASRLTVVGTTVGGAGEILRDGETGLVFPPGDPAALAEQLTRLADDRNLGSRLASQGQSFAVSRFDVSRMAEAIEQYLAGVIQDSPIRLDRRVTAVPSPV